MSFIIRIRIFFYAICLVFHFSHAAYSQDNKIGIDPEKPLNSLSMDQWTGKDGLISNNLTSVIQASSKFIWITTFNGILQFDGVNFKLFDKKTLPNLSSNAFYQSFEDSKGNLWFASQSSGIIKYKDHEFQQILTDNNKKLSVRCIEEDRNGVIWVGTNNSGIFTLKDTVLVKVDFDEFNVTHIMDIEVDAEGDIWFATNGNGILVYRDNIIKTITKNEGLNHNTVNKLLLSSDGKMYAGTMDGICYFSKDENKRITLFDGLEINDMFIDEYENFWVGSEQGLFKANLLNNSFDRYTEADGLPSSQISSLCFDHENSLWISTKKAGLVRLRDGSFKNITTKDGLSSKFVNIIVEHDGKVCVGCDDGLINIIDGDDISRIKLKNTFYNVGIRDINIAKDGEMLIASYRGLLKVKNGREELIDLSKYGATNDIRRILRGKDGTIWMATRSSGVVKFEGRNNIKMYNSSNELKADYILALEENSNGDIYVGTHSGGLSVIKKNGEVTNFPIGDGPGILIFNLHILDDNNIWIATNVGIYKFDGKLFKKVRIDENLKAETIFDIVIENDNVWLSLNNGLILVKLSDLDKFVTGKLAWVSGRLFDQYDGMASQECTGATRMTLSKDGNLWVPTLDGVAIINPKDITENNKIPEVYITDFKTDFNSYENNAAKKLVVEPGILRYEFNFTSLSYIAPPKVRFKYKLSRVDKDWINAGNEREAIYTNLPKGEYTFTVIASNNDGVWNENGDSLTFKVDPYFYETTVFYFLVAGCLGLLIWGIIIWRVHNVERVNTELRKLNEELDRFVYSASHDLRAPLSSVLGLVEIARLEPEISGKDKCLQMINASIKKLDGFIGDIIDYSRNQRVDLQTNKVDIEHEVNEVFSELRYLDNNEEINKEIIIREKRHFMTDGRRLSVILKNLISNAFRYHDLKKTNQYICIEIKYSQKKAIITVADNGIGIDQHHLKKIFDMFYRADESSKGSGLGLYIVKETIDKLSGEIEVNSQINKGTTFTLTIPSL